MDFNPSIVEYFAEHERYRCGYCNSPDTNYSHGMWAHQMTCRDYQDLIDRGWRRSGKYCYKPTMNVTCCPLYTIKCKAMEFQISKSQKKVIKKVNRYLITGKKGDSGISESGVEDKEGDDEKDGEHSGLEKAMLTKKTTISDIQFPLKGHKESVPEPLQGAAGENGNTKNDSTVKKSESASSASLVSQQDVQRPASGGDKRPASARDKQPPKPGSGADPSKPACKKAKQIRLEKRLSKSKVDVDKNQKEKLEKKNKFKTLEDFLSEPDKVQNCAHKLELRLVRSNPPSPLFTSSHDEAHRVYHSYQMKIHGDPPGKPNQKQYKRFLCDSPLVIRLYRSSMELPPFLLSFQESYSVYKKYQMAIHNDDEEDCDKMSFREFLIDSPLEEEHKEGGPAMGYGSFHHQYILDGKIIAVGVIDILPDCVSSVYLYYDPEYDFLGLGTYSALRELAFTRELCRATPQIDNYYMGYYVHSCRKMCYKGQYTPSFLACPESFTWVPIEKCRPLLDANRYSRLEEPGVEDKDKVGEDLSQVLVLFKNTVMPYGVYKTVSKSKTSDQGEVLEYAGFVGKPCSERMLLLRSK